jgi:hypothetical protein
MTKKKKLVKEALEHPDMYAPAELSFFAKWLDLKRQKKEAKKAEKENPS